MNQRILELARLLHEKIEAYQYYYRLGFTNALGDFEINEDLYEANKELIEEFEDELQKVLVTGNYQYAIINLERLEIEFFYSALTIKGI